MAIELKGLYDPGQAAKLLAVNRRTILRWLKDGQITALVIAGRRLIPESEIERVRKEREPELRQKAA